MKFSVYSKGKPISDQKTLRAFQEESLGIFESLRTYRGKIFRLEQHLQRFKESAQTAGDLPKISLTRIKNEIKAALHAHTHKMVPKMVPGTVGTDSPNLSRNVPGTIPEDLFIRVTFWQNQLFVMIGERKHSPALYEKGIILKTSPVPRSLSNASFPEAKTSAFQNAVLATLEPASEQIDEWLFLSHEGYVTEVRIGNIFIVQKGALLTPPERGILNGVTRRFVIECAFEIGLKVREIPFTRHDIYNAQEAFLTNTSWEILPIRELDGRQIGNKTPGLLTQKLHQIFKRKTKEECP